MNSIIKPKALEDYIIMDDIFMNLFFDEDNEVTEYLLRTVLGNEGLKVRRVVKQMQLVNPGKRGAKLDVYAEDSEGRGYDIEIQRDSEGAHPRRARYYSSLMDTRMLEPMESFKDLKDSFVIFITEEDTRKEGNEINQFEMIDIKNGRKFEDGRHIIYVNGSSDDVSTDIGKLIHDLKCKDPKDMYSEVFARRIRYLKETTEGRTKMGSEIEVIRQAAKAEFVEERNIEIAMNLLNIGKNSIEDIAKATGLPVDEIRELAKSKAS